MILHICRYYCKAYCKISGKSERLIVELEGTGVGPVTQFNPCKLDLQDLYLFSSYDYEVQLQNLGDMEVDAFFSATKYSGLFFVEHFFMT